VNKPSNSYANNAYEVLPILQSSTDQVPAMQSNRSRNHFRFPKPNIPIHPPNSCTQPSVNANLSLQLPEAICALDTRKLELEKKMGQRLIGLEG